METEDASIVAIDDTQASASVDSITAPKRVVGRPFLPGNNANPRGRPKKGESFAEKYRKQIEKAADELIAKHVERAKGAGVVASKEFALAAAYGMGRPVQPYVIANADAPADQLYTDLQSLLSGPTVDGSARLITDTETTET